MLSMPSVYIIILNWNSSEDTIECICSLQNLNYQQYKLILVDNGSTDQSEERLRSRFPNLPFIQTGSNLGYAGGNNVGIKYALEQGADYVWLLNIDTIVHPDSLSTMVEMALSDSIIGMVGSKIYFYDEKDVLWYAGGTFDLEEGGIASHLGWGQKDIGQFEQVKDVGYITGCSLLVKREVIEKIGLLPEEYFLYFEETDWNYCAQQNGFRTVIAHKSLIWHKVKRKGEAKVRFTYYMTRNRFLLVKKLKKKSLLKCIQYQYKQGKLLLTEIKKQAGISTFLQFTKILILAWIDGLILNRSGKTL